jgi:biotin transport system substrate-specific component
MKINTKSITTSAFAIAVMCVLSPLAIYIGPVPLTFSLFALYVISLYFPVTESVIIVSSYIILGAMGLPVFSGYASGMSVLFGLTGGYIWSYIIVSLFVSYFSKIKDSKVYDFAICFIGLIICYLAGTLQYCALTNNSFYAGLTVCVAPFLLFDIIKIIIAILFYDKILSKYNIVK